MVEPEGAFAETCGGVVTGGLLRQVTSWIIAGNELKMVFIDSSPLKSQEVIAESVHLLVIQPNLESCEEAFGR